MDKNKINALLFESVKRSRELTEKYFKDPEVIKRIESRKNLPKFGNAKDGNYGFTIPAKEEYFLEKDIDGEFVAPQLVDKNLPLAKVCRHCKGDHMSFKCPNKVIKEKKEDKRSSVKISNLPHDVTEDELYDLLEDFGKVDRVTIPKSIRYRNDICKHAYVNFKSSKVAEDVINELDGTHFDYLIINVCYA